MLLPLLVMALAFTALFLTLWLIRIRTAILARRIRALRLAESDEPGRFDAAPGEAAAL
jgi:heme exporter protein C